MPTEKTIESAIWIWMGIAVATFVLLRFVSAPYGRHTRSGWGPMISNKLGWAIMESPGLIVMPTLFFLGPNTKTWIHFLMLGIYLVDYLNRAVIFPLRIRTKGKKMPLLITSSAVFFNLVNTFFLGAWLGWFAQFPEDWWMSAQFLVGLAVLMIGVVINLQSDEILLHLRKPGETHYKIPEGGLFRWISCPNHFGEILEWLGYALMAWHLAAFSFAVWSIANLLPRALDHHQWYLQAFEAYPKTRKAIIPFLL